MITAPPGVHTNVTVTFELIHPAALGLGETEAVINGGPAAVTVRPAEKLSPFTAAVTIAVPDLTAVARPFALIVTTLVFNEPHATDVVTSCELPSE